MQKLLGFLVHSFVMWIHLCQLLISVFVLWIIKHYKKFANISVRSLLIRVVLKKIFLIPLQYFSICRSRRELVLGQMNSSHPNRFAENYITFGKISLRYLTFEGWRWLHALKVSGFYLIWNRVLATGFMCICTLKWCCKESLWKLPP